MCAPSCFALHCRCQDSDHLHRFVLCGTSNCTTVVRFLQGTIWNHISQALVELAQIMLHHPVGAHTIQSVIVGRENIALDIFSTNVRVLIKCVFLSRHLTPAGIHWYFINTIQGHHLPRCLLLLLIVFLQADASRVMRQAADILAFPAAMQTITKSANSSTLIHTAHIVPSFSSGPLTPAFFIRGHLCSHVASQT
jgi:hypothetical protein